MLESGLANGHSPQPGDVIRSSISALMACHNRRAKTLSLLTDLNQQLLPIGTTLQVTLLDDGSRDGTAESVKKLKPDVDVIYGDGSFFWSKGMATAQRHALSQGAPDFLLWLNDDVRLKPSAIAQLLHTAHLNPDTVVVGGLVDAATGQVTYSGYVKTGSRPLQLTMQPPTGAVSPIDTFNGNVVLIPRGIYQTVGSIDEGFRHGMGDVDYGYRVLKAGFRSVLAADPVGFCSRNADTGTFRDPDLGLIPRLRMLFGSKGLPLASYARFLRRHAPKAWPCLLVGTYISQVIGILKSDVAWRYSKSHGRRRLGSNGNAS